MAAHGYPRGTMDIDLWIEPSLENAEAAITAIKRFGAPLHDLTINDLAQDDMVFQIGVAPRRIDIITSATGLKFEQAFANATDFTIDGIRLRVLALQDLITNKRATGRPKDLADAAILESLSKR